MVDTMKGLTLFCMNNLHELGIQRAIIWIVNNWPDEYGRCALSLRNKDGRQVSFLSPNVVVYELDKIQPPLRGMATPFRVLAYYRLLKKLKPQTVIAVNQFESLALCIIKRFYRDFRLVVCEHCHVSSNLNGANAHSGWFGWYYRRFFPREYVRYADIIHTVAREAANDLCLNYQIPKEKIRVIYNPVDIEQVRRLACDPLDDPWLQEGNRTVIAASRLESQKRLDVLLHAWVLVKEAELTDEATCKPYRLIICGDGSLRSSLEGLAAKLGIADSIRFVGFQSNPWKWIKRAALFVNTSEWEGLPCSLIETQAVGTPVLSSDCPSGPKEILMDGEAGFLFPSGDAYKCADQMINALKNKEPCDRKVKVALDNIERFSINEIVRQYAGLN